ncbi:MAG: hypothetical protein OXU20_17475 [Myxococcales bacterium]|nr:hypothetical protein [Myxococcales bacterium]MDD9964956.1 hypothetical protein [Myxococcales bacterium]
MLAAGARVVVCPGCASDAGITSERLRAGMEMGDPESIAELMMGARKILEY